MNQVTINTEETVKKMFPKEFTNDFNFDFTLDIIRNNTEYNLKLTIIVYTD